jgi:hypothetical protein
LSEKPADPHDGANHQGEKQVCPVALRAGRALTFYLEVALLAVARGKSWHLTLPLKTQQEH